MFLLKLNCFPIFNASLTLTKRLTYFILCVLHIISCAKFIIAFRQPKIIFPYKRCYKFKNYYIMGKSLSNAAMTS